MSNNFTKAIEFTLPWEAGRDRSGQLRQDGGYHIDPNDPGGETKWGIAKKFHPDVDIKNLTIDGAIAIYRKEYWDVYSSRTPSLTLDNVPCDFAVVCFDSGVNCGTGRAYNWFLQSQKTKDPTKIVLGLRDKYYFDLVSQNRPRYGSFYKGWLARMNDLKKLVDIIQQDLAPSVSAQTSSKP